MASYDQYKAPPSDYRPPPPNSYPPPGQAYPPAFVAPPPAGYPGKDGAPGIQQAPVETRSRGDGFWKGCCAAVCCCCVLDVCF